MQVSQYLWQDKNLTKEQKDDVLRASRELMVAVESLPPGSDLGPKKVFAANLLHISSRGMSGKLNYNSLTAVLCFNRVAKEQLPQLNSGDVYNDLKKISTEFSSCQR